MISFRVNTHDGFPSGVENLKQGFERNITQLQGHWLWYQSVLGVQIPHDLKLTEAQFH